MIGSRRSCWSFLALAVLGSLTACGGPQTPLAIERPRTAGRTGMKPEENPFVHASGKELVDGQGRRVVLTGVDFGNEVWFQEKLPEDFHSEAEYRACRELGVNSIRFYLHHRWLMKRNGEPDERGFAWLARNVAWARQHGIWMILNVHVPPGGFQSNGGGRELWTDTANQRRFVRLWKEIARRFADEPAVLGYDLLNEPMVTEDFAQWERLARATIDAIREVDPRHVVVVERVHGIVNRGRTPQLSDWDPDRNGALNFFPVDDTNVMYTFHFYQPMAFTHQGASWVPMPLPRTATYPGRFRDWDGQERTFDRAYIAGMLGRARGIMERYDAPMYLGEFGVIRGAFGDPQRNATGWVADVIDVALEAGIGVAYHSYDDAAFGVAPRGRVNEPLADLLRAKYRER